MRELGAEIGTQQNIVSVTLTDEQAKLVDPIIERHREAAGVCGLLAVLSRSYRSLEEGVTVELQLLPINRLIAAAINKASKGPNVLN